MASIHKYGKKWHIYFRFGGRQFKPSLKATNKREAEARLAVVEETIRLIEAGRLALLPGATREQVRQFILSGGKTTEKPTVADHVVLKRVVEEYFAAYTLGKEPSTVENEHIHTRHFLRLIGSQTSFDSITTDALQEYVAKRAKEPGLRGKPLSPETTKKELRTFTQIWKMAVSKGYVSGSCPVRKVRLQLSDEKEAFKTWGQIETIIKRGKLKGEEAKEYWDCLFLNEHQVSELLDYVEKNAEHPFIYAAIAFAAFTGARRSEIMCSKIEDWDFDRGVVRIREKKGSKTKKTTFREVNIHPQLDKVMTDWFNIHPGGVHTIVVPPNLPRSRCKQDEPTRMTRNQAHGFFQRTLNGSKWQVLRGWHVLRHSFCSNCARRNISDTIIDEWMGHRGNEDVKKRYRHLFPSDKKEAMEKLFT